MSRGRRVLATIGGALLGMIVLVIVEFFLMACILTFLAGNPEGGGIVVVGLAPFVAILGMVLGGFFTWRRVSRAPTPGV
jgi:hypothetical protein